MILIWLCLFLNFNKIYAQNDVTSNGPYTSFYSLNELCTALISNNFDYLKTIVTPEGYDILLKDRGMARLSIDALFWMQALSDGKVFVSEYIETEKEFDIFISGQEHETLFICSYSDSELMLIEKVTFIKEGENWKFLLFEDG